MLHFEQRRCERHNQEFNRFLTYIRIFFTMCHCIMMCENKDCIIIIIGFYLSTVPNVNVHIQTAVLLARTTMIPTVCRVRTAHTKTRQLRRHASTVVPAPTRRSRAPGHSSNVQVCRVHVCCFTLPMSFE